MKGPRLPCKKRQAERDGTASGTPTALSPAAVQDNLTAQKTARTGGPGRVQAETKPRRRHKDHSCGCSHLSGRSAGGGRGAGGGEVRAVPAHGLTLTTPVGGTANLKPAPTPPKFPQTPGELWLSRRWPMRLPGTPAPGTAAPTRRQEDGALSPHGGSKHGRPRGLAYNPVSHLCGRWASTASQGGEVEPDSPVSWLC